MKKFLAVLLAGILSFSFSGAAFAQEFTDVEGHWAAQDINEAKEAGIVSGDGNGLFRPNDTITRAEYFKMLTATVARLFDLEIPVITTEVEHWVVPYNNLALYINLYGFDYETEVETASGKVNPAILTMKTVDYNIERWEMAYLIFGVFQAIGLEDVPVEAERLNDQEAISAYPESIQKAINSCAEADIIKGDENANFNPGKNGTRAEAVVMIKRFLNSLTILIGELTSSQDTENKEEQETMINETVKTYTEAEIPKENVKVKFTMEDGATFTAELYPQYAPQTVANFVALVKAGFYDGLSFHRIVDGFVVQGGDPKGDGTGGAEHNIVGEFATNGWTKNTLSHEEGVLSMARSSLPNSASSQFFICIGDCTGLDGMYASFGKVIEGMDAVKFLTKVERKMGFDGAMSSPVEPVIMKKVEIVK